MRQTTKERVEQLYQQINEIAGIYHGLITDVGISDHEFWVWYSLVAVSGEHTQQSICAAWSLSKQTVNTIVKHMVEKGYAVLDVVPGTRNRKAIRLTEAGEAYGKHIIEPIYLIQSRAFERLGEEKLDTCREAFAEFIQIINEETYGKKEDAKE